MTETQNKMLNIAALTGGGNHAASRFRIRQHISLLKPHGIEVQEFIPYWGESCGLPSPFKAVSHIPGVIKSRKADITWICRHLVQGYETFERLLKRPRIMDVDDAIWLSKPFGGICQPHIAKGVDGIIAGNDYLAEYYQKYCKNIFIVPTAVDLDRYTPADQQRQNKDKFVIGWTGLASNYRYLKLIEPALGRIIDKYPDVEILIISNRPWTPERIPSDRIRFVQWDEQAETHALHKMSVGIMPLCDDQWTKGKCSFKMLQYMATAMPVVVSPVGMNLQVMEKGEIGFAAQSQDEWFDAVETLYKDRAKGVEMGKAARGVVEQYYSAQVIAGKLAGIFRSFAGG